MGAFEFQADPDTDPPTVPQNLTATEAEFPMSQSFRVELLWDASSDSTGVAHYEIFRDGSSLGTVTGTACTDDIPGLPAPVTFTYTVTACDAAGNCSESDPLSVTVPEDTPGVVTNDNDSGPGSLRQCVLNAESGSLITFSDDHIITLDSKIIIEKDLTVDAEGFAVTLQADAMPGVAGHGLLTVSEDAAVTVRNMTLRHGRGTMASAAVQSDGTLTLEDCAVTENHALHGYDSPGIENTGTLTVVRSLLSDHGSGP